MTSWKNAGDEAEREMRRTNGKRRQLEARRTNGNGRALLTHPPNPVVTTPAPRTRAFPVLAASDVPLPPQSFDRPETSLTRVDRENMTTDEARELDRRMWRRAFAEERMTLEDTLPWRVRTAWRIVREIAWIRGLLSEGHTLSDCLRAPSLSPTCPWLTPTSDVAPQDAHAFHALRALVAEGTHPRNPELATRGLPLLPPLAPDPTPERYSPHEDPELKRYCAAIEMTADSLGVYYGSELEPRSGWWGMRGMVEPELVRAAFPPPAMILSWDRILVEETVELLAQGSRRKAVLELHKRYGLISREAEYLVSCALNQAKKMTEATTEEARALMVLRLENVVDRARDAMDLGPELQALKVLAVIRGLGKQSGRDPNKEFMRMISESKARDPKRGTEDDE